MTILNFPFGLLFNDLIRLSKFRTSNSAMKLLEFLNGLSWVVHVFYTFRHEFIGFSHVHHGVIISKRTCLMHKPSYSRLDIVGFKPR